MALVILRDSGRAEEVTQDIFLKLWRALPLYDGRAAVSTWLYAICLRVAARRRRSARSGIRRWLALDSEGADRIDESMAASQERTLEHQQEQTALEKLLATSRTAMSRRDRSLTAGEEAALRELFAATAGERATERAAV